MQADALKVYSENCVVFLLTVWVRSHAACTPVQLEQLAHNVRVVNLSLSYIITILPHLEWFRGCSGMEALPSLLLQKVNAMDVLTSWSGPAAWRLRPRSRVLSDGSQPTKLSVTIGCLEVKRLAKGERIYGESVYHDGLYFKCSAFTSTSGAEPNKRKTLGLFLHTSATDMEATLGITWTKTRGISVRYSWWTPAYPQGSAASATLMGSEGAGTNDCLGRSCPNIEEAVSFYVAKGMLQLVMK